MDLDVVCTKCVGPQAVDSVLRRDFKPPLERIEQRTLYVVDYLLDRDQNGSDSIGSPSTIVGFGPGGRSSAIICHAPMPSIIR